MRQTRNRVIGRKRAKADLSFDPGIGRNNAFP
jgi:hypothetical protein